MRHTLLITMASLLGGCVIGSDKWQRPRDLDPAWLVDRTRVLGMQAEPPELVPGQAASFSVLAPDPEGALGGKLWIACSPEQTTPFGCAVDLSVLDGEPTPEELIAAGVIGMEPGFAPAWAPPTDALDDLEPEDRLEGVQYTVQVIGLPGEGLDTGEGIDFASFEIGYKRVVVSEAPTPNANPEISGFTVEGAYITTDTVVLVDPGQTYELGLMIPDESIEVYEYVNPEGVVEERVEQPYAQWYSTDGDEMEETTLYPFVQANWTAPAASGATGSWYSVVRDRRGGVAWIERRWETL